MAAGEQSYLRTELGRRHQRLEQAMQAHPDLKLFISGSGISNPAMNKAIQDTGRAGKIFSTGFALPSTMKTYLDSGVCKQYALWSPYKFGYMATYCSAMIKAGALSNKAGTILFARNRVTIGNASTTAQSTNSWL